MKWLSHRQLTLLLRPEYVAYGACALFLSTLHNLFLLYHIELYVSHYKIDEAAFFWGSVLFLVWNAVNDFVVAWVSDGSLLSSLNESGETSTVANSAMAAAVVRARRLRGLAIGGPMMGVAFVAMLVRWPVPLPVQFVITLCVYDAALTWVDLSHSSLLAELAVGADERSTLSVLSSIFSAAGSLSVFGSFFFWDAADISQFRLFAGAIAVCCAGGFTVCTGVIRKSTEMLPLAEAVVSNDSGGARASTPLSMLAYFKQMLANTNLMWFTLLSFVQTFHCHFNSNFFPIILGVLLEDHLTPFSQSLLLGLSFLLPHLNNVYFSTVVARVGSYPVIRYLLFTKLALGGTMLVLGRSSWVVLCIFVASNRVFTEGCCKLLNLVVSDLIDEDSVLHSRETSISALIFGTTNLFTKPGQSLAPLIGTYYMARHCDGFIFSPSKVLVGHELEKLKPSSMDGDEVKNALFTLVVWVPIFSALIQLVAWSQYRLHGRQLQKVRAKVLEKRLRRPGSSEHPLPWLPSKASTSPPRVAPAPAGVTPIGGKAPNQRTGYRRVVGSFDL